MTDKDLIKRLMLQTGQKCIADALGYGKYNQPIDYVQYENVVYGENITFEFDQRTGDLIAVYS